MVYASSFIFLHRKGSSLQNRIWAIFANGVRKENGKKFEQHF